MTSLQRLARRVAAPPLVRHYGTTLRSQPLRRLWVAALASEAGDWAAVLALTLLVYRQTHSPLAATAVTAATLLPQLGIGQLMSTLADRHQHRRVMAAADITQAGAFLLLALVPLPAVAVLAAAFLSGCAAPAFKAARGAALPQLAAHRYEGALMVFNSTNQLCMLGGFAIGGALLTVLHPAGVLALNAATFGLSAALVTSLPPTSSGATQHSVRGLLRAAAIALWGDRWVRYPVLVVNLAAFGPIAAETLVIPYTTRQGHGAAVAGLLAAAPGLTGLVTATLLPQRRTDTATVRMVLAALGAVTTVAAVLLLLRPPLAVAAVAFCVNGVAAVMTVPLVGVVGRRLPATVRATAFSMIAGMAVGVSAAAALLSGALAQLTSPAAALGWMALLSVGVVAALAPPLLRLREGPTWNPC